MNEDTDRIAALADDSDHGDRLVLVATKLEYKVTWLAVGDGGSAVLNEETFDSPGDALAAVGRSTSASIAEQATVVPRSTTLTARGVTEWVTYKEMMDLDQGTVTEPLVAYLVPRHETDKGHSTPPAGPSPGPFVYAPSLSGSPEAESLLDQRARVFRFLAEQVLVSNAGIEAAWRRTYGSGTDVRRALHRVGWSGRWWVSPYDVRVNSVWNFPVADPSFLDMRITGEATERIPGRSYEHVWGPWGATHM